MMNDPANQQTATTALDSLLEVMPTEIDQYLPMLMERFVTLLDTAPISIKSVVAGAIGSAAHASKTNFLPYFQPVMEKHTSFLLLQGEGAETELRGISMDSIGTFAEALGRDAFRPWFQEMMKQAFAWVEVGSPRLRECSFLLFGVLARVFEEEFGPYFPNVVAALLASWKQQEKGEELLGEHVCLSVLDDFL